MLFSSFTEPVFQWDFSMKFWTKISENPLFIRLLNVILIITQQSILLTIPVAFISKSPYPFLWFCCTVIVCRIRENMHNLFFYQFSLIFTCSLKTCRLFYIFPCTRKANIIFRKFQNFLLTHPIIPISRYLNRFR